MIPRLVEAHHIDRYRLWLRFQDGTEGEVDLEGQLWGEVFEPLRDQARFRQFRIDPELHTLTWPNGADLAPEYLYQSISA